MSERGDGDRRQEYDRSNLSDASEHKHDDDEDIEDTRARGASITIDLRLGYESDDGKRTLGAAIQMVSSLLAMKTMMARMMSRTGKATRTRSS